MATYSAAKITAKGRAKIKKIRAAANAAAADALLRLGEEFRDRAAELAPDPQEEAQMLSEGAAMLRATPKTRQEINPKVIGTPDGGRFLFQSTIPIRQAIQMFTPVVVDEGDRLRVVFGSYDQINAVTGFSWETRRRGIQGPSRPFDFRYAQAMENGGVWTVVPRGNWMLEPKDGVLAWSMIKSLPPRGMFRMAYSQVRAKATRTVKATVKNALRATK